MRKYEALWNKIKGNSKASCIAEVSLHSRIIQAVKKEKNEYDLGWKLQQLELGKKYYLKYKTTDVGITFYLEETKEFMYKL